MLLGNTTLQPPNDEYFSTCNGQLQNMNAEVLFHTLLLKAVMKTELGPLLQVLHMCNVSHTCVSNLSTLSSPKSST